jgi:hypothetical protein
LLATIAISFGASLPAHTAQRARVFVSVTGNDANPCTAGSPCKTFQAAHDAVLAGGEISVLDTGGYGTLIITKALSIVAIGVEASIANTGVGITINANPGDKVSLRGLILDGAGQGGTGIAFNSGTSLTVDDCVIRNMAVFGLAFASNAATPQTLAVSNSSFSDNGNAGVQIETTSSGAITASFDRTAFNGNLTGLAVNGGFGTGPLTVAVTDSVAANNRGSGFGAGSSAGQSVTNLSLTRSQALGNVIGILANGTATLWLSQSTVTGNTAGFDANGGIIKSYGDNNLQAANGPNTGSLTTAMKQ